MREVTNGNSAVVSGQARPNPPQRDADPLDACVPRIAGSASSLGQKGCRDMSSCGSSLRTGRADGGIGEYVDDAVLRP